MTTAATKGTFECKLTELFIHDVHMGFVLGKGRSTVSRIARETKTRVDVAADPTSGPYPAPKGFGKLVICGRSEGDVGCCYHRLLDIARAAEAKLPPVKWCPGVNPGVVMLMNPFVIRSSQGVEVRLIVARPDVGMVLGSKGRTLRKLTSDTWTWSKVFQGEDSSEFSIRGYTERDVDECVKRLLSIAQESYRRRTTGKRHVKAGTISALSVAGPFQLAPVPQSRRKRGSGSAGTPPPLPSPSTFPTPTAFMAPPSGPPPSGPPPSGPMTSPHSGPLYSAESPTYSPPW
jgi:hypothetical protein